MRILQTLRSTYLYLYSDTNHLNVQYIGRPYVNDKGNKENQKIFTDIITFYQNMCFKNKFAKTYIFIMTT